jgi:hypothetical protein
MKKFLFLAILSVFSAVGLSAAPESPDIGTDCIEMSHGHCGIDVVADVAVNDYEILVRQNVETPASEATYETLEGVKSEFYTPPLNSYGESFSLFNIKRSAKLPKQPVRKVAYCFNCATGYWC